MGPVPRTEDQFEAAWQTLHPGFRRSLEGSYEGLARGGLACGAALTQADERILAVGRNRAYDPPGGSDILQGSPLAHAEMNVLAAVRTEQDLTTTTLWSTQEPCAMCAAAAEFIGVGTVRYMAPDPSAIATDQPAATRARIIGPAEDLWIVVANVFFLLAIATSRGLDHPTVARNRELEPETATIVVELIEHGRTGQTLTQRRSLPAMLAQIWDPVVIASRQRSSRLPNAVRIT